MQNYRDRQKKLIQEIEKGYREKRTSLNPGTADDFTNDPRLALVCLYFVPEEVQEVILNQIIAPLRAADPSPYYYPRESLHLTIKNVRYVHWPPQYTAEDKEKVCQGFRKIIPRQEPFAMELEGIFEQPSSLSVSGFSDDSLFHLITVLNQTLEEVGVPDNKKYFSGEVYFGNVSFCRFQRPPNQAFRDQVQKLKKVPLGTVQINKVWLVETDLVCHPGHTTVLEKFSLGFS